MPVAPWRRLASDSLPVGISAWPGLDTADRDQGSPRSRTLASRPYDYVRNGLALDFWSLLSLRWVNTRQLGL